jgi:oxygen-independent coproporphyrinogen-3 oxidase
MPGLGLYIHYPFCLSKCRYCNFASEPLAGEDTSRADTFLEALCQEISRLPEGTKAETLYFGGGTPSLIPLPALEKIFQELSARQTLAPGAEITLEINPATVQKKHLETYASLGINRLSLGLQSMQENRLRWMGRAHTVAENYRLLELVRQSKITNFGCDIIFGLPGETWEECRGNFESILEFSPPHLSVYGLSLEPETPLFTRCQNREFAPLDEDTYAAFYHEIHHYLREKGYGHYEISNYAQPGFESRHNFGTWRYQEYLGLGCAAHSFRQGRRSWHASDLDSYLAWSRAGQVAPKQYEEIDINLQWQERIILALRTSEGLLKSDLESTQEAAWSRPMRSLLKFINTPWVEETTEAFRLTLSGWLCSNQIFSALLDRDG